MPRPHRKISARRTRIHGHQAAGLHALAPHAGGVFHRRGSDRSVVRRAGAGARHGSVAFARRRRQLKRLPSFFVFNRCDMSRMRANKEEVDARGEDYAANEQDQFDETIRQEPVRVGPKVGRNDPCPCGSGKKYKKCHGAA